MDVQNSAKDYQHEFLFAREWVSSEIKKIMCESIKRTGYVIDGF
jgi:hypothetical protein